MNPYLRNLEKLEFAVTFACTGRCRQCSEGGHKDGAMIDPALAARAVSRIAERVSLQTVMAFGGEPLLHPEAVYAILQAAREAGVPRRQIITNGYFTRSAEERARVASRLAQVGVNDLLLSVDAFHQETIPLSCVRQFAEEAVARGIPLRLQPAWLVGREADNPYNRKTGEILASFADLGIPVGAGNVVFPEGNAKKYLAEYLEGTAVENPYVEDPRDVRCVSVSPDGRVLHGNLYEEDILDILENYKP